MAEPSCSSKGKLNVLMSRADCKTNSWVDFVICKLKHTNCNNQQTIKMSYRMWSIKIKPDKSGWTNKRPSFLFPNSRKKNPGSAGRTKPLNFSEFSTFFSIQLSSLIFEVKCGCSKWSNARKQRKKISIFLPNTTTPQSNARRPRCRCSGCVVYETPGRGLNSSRLGLSGTVFFFSFCGPTLCIFGAHTFGYQSPIRVGRALFLKLNLRLRYSRSAID